MSKQSTMAPTPQQTIMPMDPTEAHKRKLLEKIRLIRDGQRAQNVGQFKDGLPEYKYIWVYNHQQEIDRFRGMHYEVIPVDDPVTTGFKGEDGHHYRGDTIGMRGHMDWVEAWNADRDLKSIEAVEGQKQEMLEWGQGNKVPIWKKD